MPVAVPVRPRTLLRLALAALLAVAALVLAPAASWADTVVVDTTPGTGPAPATLGGYDMTPVVDSRPDYASVRSVNGPVGAITFDQEATVRTAGVTWGEWSENGYVGKVYRFAGSVTRVNIDLPPGTGAFHLYVQPSAGNIAFTVAAQDGTSAQATISSTNGARYFGFSSPSAAAPLTSVTVTRSTGTMAWAVGDLGIALADDATLTPQDATTPAGVPVPYRLELAPGQVVTPSSLAITPRDGDPAGSGASCDATACTATRAGVYRVTGTLDTPDGGRRGSTELTVVPGQSAVLTLAPQDVTTPLGTPSTFTAIASDAHGNPTGAEATVTVRAAGLGLLPAPCPGGTCTPTSPGRYVVTASVPGAGGPVTASTGLTVTPAATALALAEPTATAYGDTVRPSARVTSTYGTPDGTVTFTIDGQPVGLPVLLDAEGTATGLPIAPGAGQHELAATYTSVSGRHVGAAASRTFTLARAATRTTVVATPASLTAVVSSAAGVPTGSVRFSVGGTEVGTAPLVLGTATWLGDTTRSDDPAVTATYVGSSDFAPSSARTRTTPTVLATVSPAPNAAGWHNGPVTVSFTCVAGSAPVLDCPAPVVLSAEGAGQTVTRTVAAEDGGRAVVTSPVVNIDTTAPTVALGRLRARATYYGAAPAATCTGDDGLSGVASCGVRVTGKLPGAHLATATATDLAGNTATASVPFTVSDVWVAKAVEKKGVWQVPIGKKRLVTVVSRTRPVLTLGGRTIGRASAAGRTGGVKTWTVPLTVARGTRVGSVATYKVKLAGGVRSLKVRAVR